MSLSSLFIKNAGGERDDDLDDIFSKSAGPSSVPNLKENTKKRTQVDASVSRIHEDLKQDSFRKRRRLSSKEGNSPNSVAPTKDVEDNHSTNTSDSDDEAATVPIHESLLQGPSKSSTKGVSKRKYIPADESEDQCAKRTIFVGNVPIEVAKSRPLTKKLKQHIISKVPGAKIESLRFRSVAFSKPTANQKSSDAKGGADSTSPTPQQQRQQQRTATWRDKHTSQKGQVEDDKSEKIYLSAKEKRKLAFIHAELHEQADSVNVYIIFAHPIPDELWPKNLPQPDVLDPYRAAELAVEKCNGSTFLERTIRVDFIRSRELPESLTHAQTGLGHAMDPKSCIFVGNLDFATKEEDLRAFFEGVVSSERGPPEDTIDEEGESHSNHVWVTRVRIVRDRDTQIGKGFAYVQFADRTCVDEVVAIDADKLKFAKRKLRVQRCKNPLTQASKIQVSHSPVTSSSTTTVRKSNTHPVRVSADLVVVPKGNPKLGEELSGLSKDDRKRAKASNIDRIARRLAKKKARTAMEKEKSKVDARPRSRKSSKDTHGTKNLGKKAGRPRVRSEQSVAKRNVKKL